MSKTRKKYLAAIKGMERNKLVQEIEFILEQDDAVRAGKLAEIRWVWDGEPRNDEIKHSVGTLKVPKPERKMLRRNPKDGSPVWADEVK